MRNFSEKARQLNSMIISIIIPFMKKILIFLMICLLPSLFFAETFNKKLTDEEREYLSTGKVLIKNINYEKNISLEKGLSPLADQLLDTIDKLNPKYLAEVIQVRPYDGNENFDDLLHDILYNVQDYAGIPYYSERAEAWYDLYEWAKIVDVQVDDGKTTMQAQMMMEPFDIVEETITIDQSDDMILYVAQNENKLRYLDKFDCIWPQKMKICILLFRDGDNWIFYGIGGVNAPRIPFFTERIQTSFINRIKTFCSFIFEKFN